MGKAVINQTAKEPQAYMIFVEGGTSPTCKHPTFDDAYREVIRLSKMFPDKEIMVLKYKARYRAKPKEIE